MTVHDLNIDYLPRWYFLLVVGGRRCSQQLRGTFGDGTATSGKAATNTNTTTVTASVRRFRMLRIEERTGVDAARVRLLLLLVGQIGQILHAAAEPGTGIDQHVLLAVLGADGVSLSCGDLSLAPPTLPPLPPLPFDSFTSITVTKWLGEASRGCCASLWLALRTRPAASFPATSCPGVPPLAVGCGPLLVDCWAGPPAAVD
uniref:Uncharacterized protein n=1 Tax=Anopheles merus TaxID=30066 RepID=A0A182V4H0_ANOME